MLNILCELVLFEKYNEYEFELCFVCETSISGHYVVIILVMGLWHMHVGLWPILFTEGWYKHIFTIFYVEGCTNGRY